MAKKKKKEEDEWSDEDLVEEKEEFEKEDIDISKLKFTKIKDLVEGMTDINIEATVDFVGETYGKGFGEDPFAIGFIKDDSGEIKISFWGEDIPKARAKPKKKVRIIKASVGSYRDQLQVYPDRAIGIEFV